MARPASESLPRRLALALRSVFHAPISALPPRYPTPAEASDQPSVLPLQPHPRFLIITVPEGTVVHPLLLKPLFPDDLEDIRTQLIEQLPNIWSQIRNGTWTDPVEPKPERKRPKTAVQITPKQNEVLRLLRRMDRHRVGITSCRARLKVWLPLTGEFGLQELLRKGVVYAEDGLIFVDHDVAVTVLTKEAARRSNFFRQSIASSIATKPKVKKRRRR